jgi:hypothetical protein
MRLPSFSACGEALYVYRENLMRLTNTPVFDDDGRATRSLCFGAVSAGTKKVLVIFGRNRPRRNVNRQMKSFLILI